MDIWIHKHTTKQTNNTEKPIVLYRYVPVVCKYLLLAFVHISLGNISLMFTFWFNIILYSLHMWNLPILKHMLNKPCNIIQFFKWNINLFECSITMFYLASPTTKTSRKGWPQKSQDV